MAVTVVILVLPDTLNEHGDDVQREHAGPATTERPKSRSPRSTARTGPAAESCRAKAMVGS
ncbi:MAG: hypothetical protein ACRD2W_25635, partial [Acidimicrobiales bacterium]